MLSGSLNESIKQTSNDGKLRHLLSLEGLDKKILIKLLKQAQKFILLEQSPHGEIDANNVHTLANLFYEPSTRTRASFEIAAKRLGFNVMNFDIENSSGKKGETIFDTAMTLKSLGVNTLVIRHNEIGLHGKLVQKLGNECAIVNAGEGHMSHPTQGLLDLLTIEQTKQSFKNLIVTIVGDIAHSRVARSTAHGLSIMGVKELRFVSPQEFAPQKNITTDAKHYTDLHKGLEDADVVMALRIQHERINDTSNMNLEEYIQNYRLTEKNMNIAAPDAIVMHPGPMNRDIEIESSLADSKQSVILRQVANGVAVRMSLLSELAKNYGTDNE